MQYKLLDAPGGKKKKKRERLKPLWTAQMQTQSLNYYKFTVKYLYFSHVVPC